MSKNKSSIHTLFWNGITCVPKDGREENLPPARSGHTISMIGYNLYVFGGLVELDFPTPQNDIFILRFHASENNEWMKVKHTGIVPPARWNHSASQISASEILIFGGFTSMMGRLNDFWVYNVVTRKWREVQLNSSDNCLSPRGSHTADVFRNSVFIYGGHGGEEYERNNMNDLHQLDLDKWTCKKIIPKGKGPEKRCGHVSCIVENKLYVLGGWNEEKRFNDMFILNLDADESSPFTWGKIEDSCLSIPRWNHAACNVGHRIFVFGGIQESYVDDDCDIVLGNYSNDIIVYDTSTSKCISILQEGKTPNSLSDTSIVYFEKESIILFYGGWANKWYSELFYLDLKLLFKETQDKVDKIA